MSSQQQRERAEIGRRVTVSPISLRHTSHLATPNFQREGRGNPAVRWGETPENQTHTPLAVSASPTRTHCRPVSCHLLGTLGSDCCVQPLGPTAPPGWPSSTGRTPTATPQASLPLPPCAIHPKSLPRQARGSHCSLGLDTPLREDGHSFVPRSWPSIHSTVSIPLSD